MSPDERDTDDEPGRADDGAAGTAAADEGAGEGREWRFELEDLEEGDGEDDGLVGAAEESIEPGSPTLEGVAFVLLGAVFAVLALAGMVGLL